MSRPSVLILLGVLTILVPFSGLPANFRTLLLVIFGAYVFGIGVSFRSNNQPQQLQQPQPTPPQQVAP